MCAMQAWVAKLASSFVEHKRPILLLQLEPLHARCFFLLSTNDALLDVSNFLHDPGVSIGMFSECEL